MGLPLRTGVVGFVVLAAVSIGSPRAARADPPPLTLEQAIAVALAQHPALHTASAAERVSTARTAVARADEFPRVGLSGELLRGTGNVLPGALFPMPGIPAVSGPPMSPPRFDGGAWGVAVGVWGAWDLTDITRRMALVDAALRDEHTARASTDARRLEIAYQAADAFLAVADAHEVLRALDASVTRAEAFTRQVRALSAQQLRPGADLARSEADLAHARITLIHARQALATREARLAEALGIPGQHVTIDAASAVGSPPGEHPLPHVEHPLLSEADRVIDAARARQHAVDLEFLPRVDLVAALWLRGSGYPAGSAADLGAAQGLVPDTPNWAAGIVVSWPILELFAVRARARVAGAQVELARARRTEIAQAIAGQMEEARAVLEGALAVARETAPALAAASAAEEQARARYQAGLGTAVEVADAERLVAQAEVEAASARLATLRAMLLVARATGDLAPFLAQVHAAPAGGP